MADAFGAENLDSFADGIGPADFSRMADDAETLAASVIERGAKIGGGEGECSA